MKLHFHALHISGPGLVGLVYPDQYANQPARSYLSESMTPGVPIFFLSHGTSPMGALGQNSSEWRNTSTVKPRMRCSWKKDADWQASNSPEWTHSKLKPLNAGSVAGCAGVEVPGLAAQITRRAA